MRPPLLSETDLVRLASPIHKTGVAGTPKIQRAVQDFNALFMHMDERSESFRVIFAEPEKFRKAYDGLTDNDRLTAHAFVLEQEWLVVEESNTPLTQLTHTVEGLRAATYFFSGLFAPVRTHDNGAQDDGAHKALEKARHFARADIACAGYLATRFGAASDYEAKNDLPIALQRIISGLNLLPLALTLDGTLKRLGSTEERASLPHEGFDKIFDHIDNAFFTLFEQARAETPGAYEILNSASRATPSLDLGQLKTLSMGRLYEQLTRIQAIPEQAAKMEITSMLAALRVFESRNNNSAPRILRDDGVPATVPSHIPYIGPRIGDAARPTPRRPQTGETNGGAAIIRFPGSATPSEPK